ncbi:hypothetical protein niasHT_024592 [Heterodera trifolii]|uniref:C2H2-type domain-containing protein n=1 Tax=Heterodera trifolii TaxID=157864 RepID=A0ABD2K7F6_9BILA
MSSDNNGLLHLLNSQFASATAFNSFFHNSIPATNLVAQNGLPSVVVPPSVPNIVPMPNSSNSSSSAALLHLQLLDLLVKAQQIATAKASGQIGQTLQQQNANEMRQNWTLPPTAAAAASFEHILPKQQQHSSHPSPTDDKSNGGDEQKNMLFSSSSTSSSSSSSTSFSSSSVSSTDGPSPAANCAAAAPTNRQNLTAALAHPSAGQNPSRRRRRPVANMDNTLDGLVAKRAEQMPTPMKRRYQSETEAIELPDDEQETKRMETDPDVCTRMCSVCGYQGKWVSEMIRHKRVHTAERPFKCKYCNRTSKWKADLIRHVAKTHGIRVVSKYSRTKAFELGKTFTDADAIDEHDHHDDQKLMISISEDELINNSNGNAIIDDTEEDEDGTISLSANSENGTTNSAPSMLTVDENNNNSSRSRRASSNCSSSGGGGQRKEKNGDSLNSMARKAQRLSNFVRCYTQQQQQLLHNADQIAVPSKSLDSLPNLNTMPSANANSINGGIVIGGQAKREDHVPAQQAEGARSAAVVPMMPTMPRPQLADHSSASLKDINNNCSTRSSSSTAASQCSPLIMAQLLNGIRHHQHLLLIQQQLHHQQHSAQSAASCAFGATPIWPAGEQQQK